MFILSLLPPMSVTLSSIVAVVLLGVYINTHPYSLAAGVGPDVFEWLMAGGGESR